MRLWRNLMGLAHMDLHDLDSKCAGQRYWYVFLISSLLTFFGGLCAIIGWRIFFETLSVVHDFMDPKIKKWVILLIVCRFWVYFVLNNILWVKYNRKYEENPFVNRKTSCDFHISLTYGRDFCGELISGKILTLWGRVYQK